MCTPRYRMQEREADVAKRCRVNTRKRNGRKLLRRVAGVFGASRIARLEELPAGQGRSRISGDDREWMDNMRYSLHI
jgi:hypothetical protein